MTQGAHLSLFIDCTHSDSTYSLGMSSQFSSDARSRYSAHFGSPNKAIPIANHTLVLFDAPNYADEDSQRHAQRKSFENWVPNRGGALEFMTKFTASKCMAEIF